MNGVIFEDHGSLERLNPFRSVFAGHEGTHELAKGAVDLGVLAAVWRLFQQCFVPRNAGCLGTIMGVRGGFWAHRVSDRDKLFCFCFRFW